MAASGSSHRSAALAERYAKAILAAARDAGGDEAAERVGAELSALAEAIEADTEARFVLTGPGTSRARRGELVDGMASELGLSETSRAALRVLVEAGRMGELPLVAEALGHLADLAAGRIRARVTVARAMENSERDRIAASLSKVLGADVALEEELDASVLGGVRIRAGNVLIDGTVAGRLARLKEALK